MGFQPYKDKHIIIMIAVLLCVSMHIIPIELCLHVVNPDSRPGLDIIRGVQWNRICMQFTGHWHVFPPL